MPARLVSFLLLFLTLPFFSQQASTAARVDQWIWSRGKMMEADAPTELDARAARLEAIHHDAEKLASLGVSLQSDLHQLQQGLLSKHLTQNLKKVETLSKRLRKEVGQ